MSMVGQVADVSISFTLEGAETFSTFINTRTDSAKKISKYVQKKAAEFGIGVQKGFVVENDDDKDHPGLWQTLIFWFQEPLDDTDEAEERAEKFMEFLENDPEMERIAVFGG